MSLADIRSGIKSTLAYAMGDSVNLYDFEPGAPQYPAVIVSWPTSYSPNSTYGGGYVAVIPVRVEIAARDNQSSDQSLGEFIEPTGIHSIIAAIDADPTLDGSCDSAVVTEWTQFGYREAASEVGVITATALVEVMA